MKNENTRNTVIFIVCTAAILILYQIFVLGPQAEQQRAAALAVRSEQTVAADGAPAMPSAAPTPLR